jgi:hypothetical protein
MNLRVFTLCAVGVTAVASNAGCHRDSGNVVAAKPSAKVRAPAAAPHGPTPQEMTSGMVEAATQGKSQAPVTVKFDLLQRPVEGQPLEIAIALLPQSAANPAIVDVTASEGLHVAAGDDQFEFPSVEPAQVYRHNIKVTPSAEGVYLVTLNVSLKHDQMADSRVFSLPIIVAAAPVAVPAPKGPAVQPNTPPSSRN